MGSQRGRPTLQKGGSLPLCAQCVQSLDRTHIAPDACVMLSEGLALQHRGAQQWGQGRARARRDRGKQGRLVDANA